MKILIPVLEESLKEGELYLYVDEKQLIHVVSFQGYSENRLVFERFEETDLHFLPGSETFYELRVLDTRL